MVPVLLPAVSAPTGVSVDLSLAASSAVTAASAGREAASSAASSQGCFALWFMVFLGCGSEGAGDVEGQGVAVFQGLAKGQHPRGGARVGHGEGVFLAEEGRVVQADVPGVLVLGLDAHADVARVAGAAGEVEDGRGTAAEVVAQADRDRQVQTRQHLEVLRLEDHAKRHGAAGGVGIEATKAHG